jgi:hypothetical protein
MYDSAGILSDTVTVKYLVHQQYETEPLGMKYVQQYLAFESDSMRTTC